MQAPQGYFFYFYSLKSPFLGFRVIQTGYWPDFILQSVFIIKNIFIMKNVIDFRKNGVDPRLSRVNSVRGTQRQFSENYLFGRRFEI